MAGDAFLTLGESYRLAAEVSQDTAFTIASGSVLAYVYAEDDTAVVSGAVGQTDSDAAATEHQISYLWTPAATGDYRYILYYGDGDQTLSERGTALVWPRVSKFDRYLTEVRSIVSEATAGEALQQLSTRAYRDALLLAARVFAFDNPQDLFAEITLTPGQWEYNLSALTGFDLYWSEFAEVEYPRDGTAIARPYLTPADWRLEPDRGKWSLLTTPSAGQKAGIRYTGLWTLNHTTDELPASAFQPLCLFAAGVAMGGPTANLFTRTNERGIEAQVVSYKTKSDEAAAQGKRLMDQARALWGAKKPRRRPEAFGVPGFFGVACGRRGR